ncbi:MAG: endonuclease/exonuclease/phosphatase family protein [Planctomycetota bacterium]
MKRSAKYIMSALLFVVTPVMAEPPAIPPDAGLPVIDWQDAKDYMDKPVIVQGRIVQAKNIGRLCFLNFDMARSFTAVIHEPSYKNFPSPPEGLYTNKLVRIRGVISEYNGKLQIEVSKPEQVTILEKEEAIPQPQEKRAPRLFAGTVTVAAYNVLNLFDEYDDPYHSDEGTPPKPKDQLDNLAATIRSIDADVLALEEVENRGYLERFVTAMLGDMGYEHVVCIESNDRRGIDCAVLSRLPVGPVTSYRHLRFDDGSGGKMGFRRDLLQARIEPEGYSAFSVFVVHFKSKRGGADTTEGMRVAEAKQARAVFDDLLAANKNELFLLCGDFNDTWESATLKTLVGKGGDVLQNFLEDLPPGAETYNRRQKSIIDFVLASPAMGRCYVRKSYRVIPGSVDTSGSDHNPVIAEFKLPPKR